MKGERKQHKPEINKAVIATFALPQYFERNPPITELILPIPIIRKQRSGIFKSMIFFVAYNASITGKNPQKVYNSHI